MREILFGVFIVALVLQGCSSSEKEKQAVNQQKSEVLQELHEQLEDEGDPLVNKKLCELDFQAEGIQDEISALLEQGGSLNCSCSKTYSREKLGAKIPVIKNFLRKKSKKVTYDFSPLLEAVNVGDTSLVSFMLQQDANPNFYPGKIVSPLFFAIDAGKKEVETLLLTKGASLTKSHIPYTHNLEKMERCKELGADFSIPQHKGGDVALHKAASENNVSVINFLLENGVDVNTSGVQGKTPLHVLASSQDTTGLGILLSADASVAATDESGHTPLEVAAMYSAPVFHALYAKTNLSDVGVTKAKLLELARTNDNHEVVKALK